MEELKRKIIQSISGGPTRFNLYNELALCKLSYKKRKQLIDFHKKVTYIYRNEINDKSHLLDDIFMTNAISNASQVYRELGLTDMSQIESFGPVMLKYDEGIAAISTQKQLYYHEKVEQAWAEAVNENMSPFESFVKTKIEFITKLYQECQKILQTLFKKL